MSTNYIISGIFRKPAENSQFHFDMVKLAEDTERYAFLLLKKNADPANLEKQLETEKDKIPVIHDGTPGQYYLESFRKTYLTPPNIHCLAIKEINQTSG